MFSTPEEKEAKHEKKISKIIPRSMVLFGCGLGFIILTFIVPNISDTQKMDSIKDLFRLCGLYLIAYGAVTFLSCIFLRKIALTINGIMTWFVAPTFAVWFGYEVFKIINNS